MLHASAQHKIILSTNLLYLRLPLLVHIRFQIFSLPLLGFFSPFPHGTGSLSVSKEYLALEDGPPIFSQDNTCPDLLFVTTPNLIFIYRAITVYGWSFHPIRLIRSRLYVTGLFRVRSPLLTESHLISVPSGT